MRSPCVQGATPPNSPSTGFHWGSDRSAEGCGTLVSALKAFCAMIFSPTTRRLIGQKVCQKRPEGRNRPPTAPGRRPPQSIDDWASCYISTTYGHPEGVGESAYWGFESCRRDEISGREREKETLKSGYKQKKWREKSKFCHCTEPKEVPREDKKKAPEIRGPLGVRWGLWLAEPTGSAGRRLEVLAHHVPINDLPPGREIVRAPVLVEQVVGVLPDVDAENRGLAFHIGTVLVGR